MTSQIFEAARQSLGLLEAIKTLSGILPEQIRKYDPMEVVVKFMQAKKEHPDYNKKQLCASIGVSDSYLKRVMKDLDVKSFYRHDIPVNKKQTKTKAQVVSQNSSATEAATSRKGRKKTRSAAKAGTESALQGGALFDISLSDGRISDAASPSEKFSDEYIDKLINN